MILKIKGIKSFAGLLRTIKYIASDRGAIEDYRAQSIFHNLLSTELNDMHTEITQNFKLFGRDRQGRNRGGQHVILSTSVLDRDNMNSDKMLDLMNRFIEIAFPDAMSFGSVHGGKTIHGHLVVSPNNLLDKDGTRLTKSRLRDVFQKISNYCKQRYPELENSLAFDMANWGKKLGTSEREYYQKKRNPQVVLSKDQLAKQIQSLFRLSNSKDDFLIRASERFKLYDYKGEAFGILTRGRKYRFSRLGLKPEHFVSLEAEQSRIQERLSQIDDVGLNQVKDQDLGPDLDLGP